MVRFEAEPTEIADVVEWLRWGAGQANEDLCDAIFAEVKRQREAGVFVGHPYLELLAASIERGDYREDADPLSAPYLDNRRRRMTYCAMSWSSWFAARADARREVALVA